MSMFIIYLIKVCNRKYTYVTYTKLYENSKLVFLCIDDKATRLYEIHIGNLFTQFFVIFLPPNILYKTFFNCVHTPHIRIYKFHGITFTKM